tara:strand:+ start:404 stop:883 length:480 start_codon:yes stop_codon:yes gene_type:complete
MRYFTGVPSSDTEKILEKVAGKYQARHFSKKRKARKTFSEKSLEQAKKNWKDGKRSNWSYDKEAWLEATVRTEELDMDRYYWISRNWEKTGAFVKILEKSTELNPAGLPSSVTVEVVKPVGAYQLGQIKLMNATQIFDHRAHASKENFRKYLAGEPYIV